MIFTLPVPAVSNSTARCVQPEKRSMTEVVIENEFVKNVTLALMASAIIFSSTAMTATTLSCSSSVTLASVASNLIFSKDP